MSRAAIVIPSESGVVVTLETVTHGDDNHPAGFIIGHGVGGCRAALTIDDAHFPHKWTMTGSLEGGDLSLSPSVLCRAHPEFHAYITNGRWTG